MYYRSSRSVAGKFPSHCFHSSPRCLNKVQPQPAPAKPAESSKGKNGARPGGPSIHSERPQEATCLLREYITKAIRDTAISAGKGTGGTTAVNHAMLSGVDGQLDRAASHERMETFKEEAEEQGPRTNAARGVAQPAKQAYEETEIERSNFQRELRELRRKHPWTNAEVEQFTRLVYGDHSYERAKVPEKEVPKEADSNIELDESLRPIHHEERVFTGKIRPRKRCKMGHVFEEKVEELSKETKVLLKEIDQLKTRLDTVIEAIPPSRRRPLQPLVPIETECALVIAGAALGWYLGAWC